MQAKFLIFRFLARLQKTSENWIELSFQKFTIDSMSLRRNSRHMSPTGPKRALTLELARKVKERILDQDLSPGELFMTEAQMCEEFDASHRVTREAVNRLRALGVLHSRRRKGLVVGHTNPVELLSDSLPFYGRSQNNLAELARFRYSLEVGALDLAIANATAEQVQRLRDLAEELSKVVSQKSTFAQIIPLDYAFHCAILVSTGSALIGGLHEVLLDFFRSRLKTLPEYPTAMEIAVWEHRAIARAFADRDLESARAALRAHLRNLITDLNPPSPPPAT